MTLPGARGAPGGLTLMGRQSQGERAVRSKQQWPGSVRDGLPWGCGASLRF